MAITEIEQLEFDTVNGEFTSICEIDSTHFMIAAAGDGDDGFIWTFSHDGSYGTITELDELEHDTVNGTFNSLVQVDSTHYILAYAGSANDGYVKTFSIDGSYNITEIDAVEHDTGNGSYNSLAKIDSTHYVLCYTSSTTTRLKVFELDGSYNITEVEDFEVVAATGGECSVVVIDSTHVAVHYHAGSNRTVKTFSMDVSYQFTLIDTLTHDTNNATTSTQPQGMILLDSTHLALCFGDNTNQLVRIFSFDGSYDNITTVSSLTIEASTTTRTDAALYKIDDTHFVVAHRGPADDGYIKVISVDGAYAMTEEEDLEHDTAFGAYNGIIMPDSTHAIVSYTTIANDGVVATFSIPSYTPTSSPNVLFLGGGL